MVISHFSSTAISPSDVMKQANRGSNDPPKLTPKTGRPSKALKGLPVHQCSYQDCRKVYTRKEHLLRHERTHRNELPYVCLECRQGYARQDLLKRHAVLKHGHVLTPATEATRITQPSPSHAHPYGSITSPTSLAPYLDAQALASQALASQVLASQACQMEQQQQQQHALQTGLPSAPARQLSATSQTVVGLSRLDLTPSPRSNGNQRAEIAANSLHEPLPAVKKLPEPWGAQTHLNPREQIDVDLLREASYGDLAEIRRLHLSGIDVLAMGSFEGGEPKSALFSAAKAIGMRFEEIQKLAPPPFDNVTRERLWKEIRSRAEVVQYLMFHGARLDLLDAQLREHVQRALQGDPEAAGVMLLPAEAQSPSVFRPIAAASADVRLAPMIATPTDGKTRRISLSTAPLKRIKDGQMQ